MPRVYLCFLWHMHQPFYKDLVTGRYQMPWTRLHALKDYYGMVQILDEFPEVRQTFNLVPSLMLQVEEYAAGEAADPYLELALKPADSLTEAEQEWELQNFFPGHPQGIIYRHPRYGELYDAWRLSDRNPQRARRFFGTQAFRDLQVLSQLAWFDEEFLEHDAEIRDLVLKQRDYTAEDQALMARKQREILNAVIPVYRRFAERGQIEISTTPFYHPILPLLCDSDIARVAHPQVPLPSRFQYPQDARHQLEKAREFIGSRFGAAPTGLWPSEGSVSDEVFGIASETGFRWAATDNGVLARTLGQPAGVVETYRPYRWRQGGRELQVVFRDHTLSDLIGFVYSRMGAAEAAKDFLDRIRENCRGILARGRDALVPIILDGENAWEFYDRNGRPFLRELYRRIVDDRQIQALRISDALKAVEGQTMDHVFPGSWISANFDVWIGAEEDNKAWEYLLRARQAYEQAVGGAAGAAISKQNRSLAWEELLIAEGSDWCWWYGPEHASDYRAEFDQLYRDHLTNVYRALGLTPPEELSRPILKLAPSGFHSLPTGAVRATIDGKVTSYFEWLGAGAYKVDARSGSMHGGVSVVRELFYGSDGTSLFLRLDLEPQGVAEMEARLQLRPAKDGGPASSVTIQLSDGRVVGVEAKLARPDAGGPEFAFHSVLEGRLALAALGATAGDSFELQVSIWKDGLPVDAVPQQGALEISTADPGDWPV
jgi:alpha-amylase/alpha-mannosidase (GH57 family)